jgi:hypothetical protein
MLHFGHAHFLTSKNLKNFAVSIAIYRIMNIKSVAQATRNKFIGEKNEKS